MVVEGINAGRARRRWGTQSTRNGKLRGIRLGLLSQMKGEANLDIQTYSEIIGEVVMAVQFNVSTKLLVFFTDPSFDFGSQGRLLGLAKSHRSRAP